MHVCAHTLQGAADRDPVVDIRIIDFAHAVCTATLSSASPPEDLGGPDEGFLFGLKNLTTILRTLGSN